jgi:hypothetical protein
MTSKTCGDCKFHCKSGNFCSHHGTPWLTESNGACKDFEPIPKQTVFQSITQSPEVLAAEMVFWGHDKDGEWYTSHLLDEDYQTEAEAIAATVAKLKEVVE